MVSTAKIPSMGGGPLFTPRTSPLVPVEDTKQKAGRGKSWKVMIVDDEEMVHHVSAMVLKDFRFDGSKIEIISGYSGEDARQLMELHSDTAVLLLDVVMETDDAGLRAVKYIREKLKNHYVRIILRTGQPGQAPESEVISKYDINDYKDKSELTSQKLYTSLTTALRAFSDIKRIESLAESKQSLEKRVQERTREIMKINQDLQREVKERELVNEALKKSKQSLTDAQTIVNAGSWEWVLKDKEIICSEQMLEIIGLGRDGSDKMKFHEFMEFIPAAERGVVQAVINEAMKNGAFALRHSIVRLDGTIRHAYQQGRVTFNDHKEAVRVDAVVQDITEQYSSEQKMRQLSSAIEQIADAVMITDKNGEVQYVNQAFSTITGYSKEDMLGMSPKVLKSGKHSDAFYRRMWHTITHGKVFSEVFTNRCKDGRIYHEVKTITPLKDSNGNITHFVSSGKDITERMEAQERLQHMAHHDPLTGLPNRTLLQDRLNQSLAQTQRHERLVAVLFLDMDRFKVINDTLGHDVGDELLKVVSKRLLGCIREDDTVARLGGDEFAIILNDVARREDIVMIATKILEFLEQPMTIDNHELFITCSIGISLCPNDDSDPKNLLKKADVAMYRAKAAGKNNFRFYTEEDETRVAQRLDMESKLRRALENEEFYLHYQPQISLMSETVIGFEALLRWESEGFENVSPMLFIPILEETGLIIPVGEWVLRNACSDEIQRQSDGMTPRRISVNISIRQFQDPGFIKMIEIVLGETGLAPSCLELEVTEGLLIEEFNETADTLRSIHDMGIKLSIDDFGTGYSSMNYLKRLPFDTLKIDKSFVDDIAHNDDDAAIASAIITLAHTMDMEVIAEGVETDEQLEFLYSKSCDAVQGYIFSRPLPKVDIKDFIDGFGTKFGKLIGGN